MTNATQAGPRSAPPVVSEKKPQKLLSWKDFQRRYRNRVDGNKYEWVEGSVGKTKRSMGQRQMILWYNLINFFGKLSANDPATGVLSVETDTFLSETLHRKPNIAYFSAAQILAAAQGQNQIPAFVIEVISPGDNINRVTRKVREYFEAGVRVVWHIFPELQEVHVFENDSQVYIARGDKRCSAEAVIPGFAIPVADIFELPGT